jgi:hypothetical protein
VPVTLSPSMAIVLYNHEASGLLRDRKPRTKNSMLSPSDCEDLLAGWLADVGDRDVALLLKDVMLFWTSPAMPSAKQLTSPDVLALALVFAKARHSLQPPAKSAVVPALLIMHRKQPCLFGDMSAERIASQCADAVRLVVSKFRELHCYDRKWNYFARKVSIGQRNAVLRVLELVSGDDAGGPHRETMRIAMDADDELADLEAFVSSDSSSLVAARPLDSVDSALLELETDLGIAWNAVPQTNNKYYIQ